VRGFSGQVAGGGRFAGVVCMAVASLVLLTAPAALASSGDFRPATGSPEAAGLRPWFITAGDFNGDGVQDLATVNRNSNDVTILLGDGTGDFNEADSSPVPVGTRPTALVVGDFNGDGKQDLATSNYVADSVSILIGDGTGDFAAASTIPLPGAGPLAVTVGDFDGDGKQDLAVANYDSDEVTILIGDGTGDFSEAAARPAAGVSPGWIASGDFNGDGKQDLVTANDDSDDLTILLGDGTGSFSEAATRPAVGANPLFVAVGDLNGDGNQDLVTANYDSGDVTILLGDGSGSFSEAATRPAAGDGPTTVGVGDFNGDGKQDLAVSNELSDDVTILFGDGAGNFAAATTSPEAVGSGPTGVAVADFNGDGTQDLATSNGLSDDVTIMLGDDPTVAVNDSKSVDEDADATTVDVRSNDTDSDSAAKEQIASISTGPATHGTVAITGGGDDLTYKPDANYCGAASFGYALAGGETATVSVTVACFDDPAVAVPDSKIVEQDSGASAIDVLANDADVDAGPRQVAAVTQPAHGTAAVTGSGAQVSYTPAAGYCNSGPGGAPDSFTYKLDGGSEASVSITVNCATHVAAPRLVISHRRVPLVRGRVVLELSCRGAVGQRCAGSLTLKATALRSRLTAAAASRTSFDIAAGRSKTLKVKPTRALRAILRKRGKAVASVTTTLRGEAATSDPLKLLISIRPSR
jgi:hypothetical protein